MGGKVGGSGEEKKHGNRLCEKSLIESEKKSQLRAVSPLTRQASVMAFHNAAMMKVK